MAGPEKRLIRSKSGLRVIPIKDCERSPFELCEPVWMKDNESAECLNCSTKFDFVRRRHHCRRCGKLYCDSCCKTRLSLPRMCFLDPVRVCNVCAKVTREENEFYEKDMKMLTTGSLLRVAFIASEPVLSYVTLSADHCYILIPGSAQPSLPVYRIGVNSVSMEGNEESNSSHPGVTLYLNGDGDTLGRFEVPSEKPPSAPVFLTSLLRAFNLVETP